MIGAHSGHNAQCPSVQKEQGERSGNSRRFFLVLLAAGGLALVAWACGGGGVSTPIPPPTGVPTATQESEQAPQGTVRVIEVSSFIYWIDPEPIELKVGEAVQFKITSLETEHTFTIEALGVDVLVGIRKTELSQVVTPQTAGSFDIICKRHRTKLSRTEGRFPQLIVTGG